MVSVPATFSALWLSQVRIRPIRHNDLSALEWEGEYIHFRRLYQSAYGSMLEGRTMIWVADLPQHGVIGQMFIQLISTRVELADGRERAYLYGFRIRPAYRRAGLGTVMLHNAELDLQRRGFSEVALNVGQDNPQARQLYERLGYRVTGSDPGEWSYLDHQGVRRKVVEPAWRMLKSLEKLKKP